MDENTYIAQVQYSFKHYSYALGVLLEEHTCTFTKIFFKSLYDFLSLKLTQCYAAQLQHNIK